MTSADTVGLLATAPFAPFSVSGLKPDFTEDPGLSKALAAVVTKYKLSDSHYSFAVVDLTDDPKNTPGFSLSQPAYAGVRDTKYDTVASMGKLLPLYGSYQLRYDLRKYIEQQKAGTPIADIGTLAQQVCQIYRQQWRAAEDNQDIPLIEKMFADTVTPSLDFRRGGTEPNPVPDSDLSAIDHLDVHHKQLPDPRYDRTHRQLRNRANLVYELDPPPGDPVPGRLHFFEQLRLMARWSNDISAAIVIESLGFPYLWQLSLGSGLFRRKWEAIRGKNGAMVNKKTAGGKGGLFLAWDYHGGHWDDAISGWGKSPRDTPVHMRFSKDTSVSANAGPIPAQGGTARSVATLMVALAQDKLVGDGLNDFDLDGHAEIRELLRKQSNFDPTPSDAELSPIGEGIYGAKPDWVYEQAPWKMGGSLPDNLAVSKIGTIPGHFSDAVLVRATRPPTSPTSPKPVQITAVLVGINRASNDDQPLRFFGTGVAEALELRHPRPE